MRYVIVSVVNGEAGVFNDKYSQLWEYVNTKPCNFQCEFDNVTIYKWQENTWLLHKKYEFM